jgi:hypothetical protein
MIAMIGTELMSECEELARIFSASRRTAEEK